MTRRADIGRKQAYRAEQVAFGGYWWQDSCTSPKFETLNEAVLFHNECVAILRKGWSGDVPNKSPNFRVGTTRAHWSSSKWECLYTAIGALRRCTVMHEVAHWATNYAYTHGRAHGPEFRECYAFLIRAFAGPEVADVYLRECDKQPVMKVAAGPRKRWKLQQKVDGVWIDAPPGTLKLLPNAAKCAMHRGDEVDLHSDGKIRWFRMVVVSE